MLPADIFFYLILLSSLIITSYFLGHIILSFFDVILQPNSHIYYKVILGFCTIISLYAIFRSNLHSYLLSMIPIGLYLLYLNKSNFISGYYDRLKNIAFKPLLVIIGLSVIVFILTLTQIFTIRGAYLDLHPNFSFYSGVSEILHMTGIESIYFDKALNREVHFTFYHYFEFWLNAIFLDITRLPSLYILVLVVFPFFATICCFGVYTIFREYQDTITKSSFTYFICSLLILFVAPFLRTFRWLLNLNGGDTPWNWSVLDNISIKSVIVLSGLILCYIIYVNHRKFLPIAIIILGIMYLPTMVLLIPSMACWYVFNVIVKDTRHNKIILVSIGILGISFAWILWQTHSDNVFSSSILSLIYQYFANDWSRLYILIKEPVLRTGWIFLTHLPFIVLGLYIFRVRLKSLLRSHSYLISFVTIAYILGVSGIALISFTNNGDQLMRNLFDPLFILTSTIVLVLGLFKSKDRITQILAYLTLSIVIVFNVYPTFRAGNHLNLKAHLQFKSLLSNKLNNVVFVNNQEFYKNTRRKNIYFIMPYHNLRGFFRGYFPQSLSLDKIKMSTLRDLLESEPIIKNANYYNQIVKLKKRPEKIIEQDSIMFIFVENNIKDTELVDFLADYRKYSMVPYDLYVHPTIISKE